MTVEIKKDEAKKELDGILGKEESKIKDNRKSLMSESELKALEAKEKEDAKKAEESRLALEAQAKKDAELLLKKDEELTEETDKKRKTELLEAKRKEEEGKLSADEKIKRVEEKSQKRIDELVNKLKEVTDKTSKEAELLRNELGTLRKEKDELSKPKDDIHALVKREEKEKQSKYLEEDKSLPREDRREMSKDEIDDWMLEDQTEAIAWINRRELRRAIDLDDNFSKKQLDNRTKDLLKKQISSFERVAIKHPDLNVEKRTGELKAQGKSESEIKDILRQENKKYDLVLKISAEHPEWKTDPDAPEKVAAEMEKRLDLSSSSEKEDSKISELIKRIEDLEAEKAERESSDEGINSTHIPKARGDFKLSEAQEDAVKFMKSQKMPQSDIDAVIETYRQQNKK